jgi:hypothetical protein
MFLGGLSTGRAGGSFPAAALASLSHRGLHLFGNFLFWKIASLIVRTKFSCHFLPCRNSVNGSGE